MGLFQSKQKHSRQNTQQVTEADHAVLQLKTTRRKLESQRTRLDELIERELAAARELIAARKKERALVCMKKKKLYEMRAATLDSWLLNVEDMLGSMETAKHQAALFTALKEGNAVMKQLQNETKIEDVEKLMQDGAEAKEYLERVNEVLGVSLSAADEDAVAAEFETLEHQMIDAGRLELPSVPTHSISVGEVSVDVEEDSSLDKLPSVPTDVVDLRRHAEASGGVVRAEEPLPA